MSDFGKDFDLRGASRTILGAFYHHSRSLHGVDEVLTYSFSSLFAYHRQGVRILRQAL